MRPWIARVSDGSSLPGPIRSLALGGLWGLLPCGLVYAAAAVAVVASFLAVVFAPQDAHAYLDPATGSLIIQTIVGGVAATALVIKTYWKQIKARFGGGKVEGWPEAGDGQSSAM